MLLTHLNRPVSACVVIALATMGFASCRKASGAVEGSNRVVEDTRTQRTFASAEEAGKALVEAARAGDRAAILAIFGPGSEAVLFTGDGAADTRTLRNFVAAYDRMHRWGPIKAGGEILHVGADNYPFPIPIDRDNAGRWSFDTAAGKDEILARRIGNNELAAIAAVSAIVDAERQYFAQPRGASKVRQYAQRFASDHGTQSGLYWESRKGEAPSPLGRLSELAAAAGQGDAGGTPQPFNGYLFRILTRQGPSAAGGARDYIVDGQMTGGFAILAYPAVYRDTGIMTFLAGKEGVVYQKDLGEKTSQVAAAMKDYNPGDGWTPVISRSDEARTRGTSGRQD